MKSDFGMSRSIERCGGLLDIRRFDEVSIVNH